MKTKFKFQIQNMAICALVLICAFAFVFACVQNDEQVCDAATDFKSVGKSAYMVDYATGTVLYSRNENERLPIASMVKIMTSLLTFESVDSGKISLDDDGVVIVASANDSCVALAEHISGSVEAFVARMNERAAELGMENTAFKNCTGLPAAESFSSAKDVSIMFSQLIKHPKYFDYSQVWLEDYKHPDGRATTITNTNKLVKFYQGCDGGKTGFTSEAKFCLCATAKRNDMRVISVIIGADSSKVRNAAISASFDYAFANFSNKVMLKGGEKLDFEANVTGGKQSSVSIAAERDLTRFVGLDDKSKYDVRYEISDVKAPLKAGDKVGVARLLKDGVEIDSVNVVSLEDVQSRNLFDAILDIARNWSTMK